MYKVFFNDRKIILNDKLPEIKKARYDYISTFRDVEDLKSQLMRYLKSDRKGDLYIWHSDSNLLMDTFNSCFRVIQASGGLIKNSKGEDLIIFRRGRWDLPKGKAEFGESPEQTAIREVEEECHLKGLQIKRYILTTYHIYFLDDTPVLKTTLWYEMKYEGKEEPKPYKKEDITKFIWLPFSQLNRISGKTFPNVLDVIRAGQR